jgi:hypothetical protein
MSTQWKIKCVMKILWLFENYCSRIKKQ